MYWWSSPTLTHKYVHFLLVLKTGACSIITDVQKIVDGIISHSPLASVIPSTIISEVNIMTKISPLLLLSTALCKLMLNWHIARSSTDQNNALSAQHEHTQPRN